jgi:hypothetical protein
MLKESVSQLQSVFKTAYYVIMVPTRLFINACLLGVANVAVCQKGTHPGQFLPLKQT